MRERNKTRGLTIVFVVCQLAAYGIIAFGFVAVWAGWIK